MLGLLYSGTAGGGPAVCAADGNSADANAEKLKSRMGGKSVRVTERGFKAPVLICIFACVLFVCAILFTCLQLSAFKESQYDFLRSGVEYTFADGDKSENSELYVTGYCGNSPEAVIPERIENHPVTRISENAFAGNRKIKRLIIEGDTQINLRAFYCCPKLTSVKADKVTQIETEAFFGCVRLKEVSISSAVTLGKRAFFGCGFTELKIPAGANALTLGEFAFADCTSLKEISVDREIVYPQNAYVFFGATSLVSLSLVNLPKDATLASVLGTQSPALESLSIKNLDAICDNFCNGFASLKSFTVKNLEDKRIGAKAFYQCASLEEINLPDAVTSVGNYAFSDAAITSFDGNKLERVGACAFERCKALKTFSLEGNSALNYLGDSAFRDCESLQNFVVPADMAELSAHLFSGCKSLESVVFLSDDWLYEIATGAFRDCASLKNIDIPRTVTKIGAYAFRGCAALTGISLPERIKQIESYTLADCTGLQNLYIPENVSAINPYAFSGCTSLLSFTVGGRISGFGLGMLQGCTSLKEISVPLNTRLSNLFGGTVPDSLKKAEVTHVTSLPSGAFGGCAQLRTVILNESLTAVADDAFVGCYRLYEIFNLGGADISCGYALAIHNSAESEMPKAQADGYTAAYLERLDKWFLTDYPENVAELVLPSRFVCDGEVVESYAVASYLFCDMRITSVLLPTSVDGIGAYGFFNCDIERAELLSAADIGASAFGGCRKLQSLRVPGGKAIKIGDGAFLNCSSLERVEISPCATVGVSAFENCTSLKSAEISAGGGAVGERAFYGCASLEKFTVPQGVSSIGALAFGSCGKLNYIILPSSLRGINSDAFSGCERLRAVVNYSPLTVSAGSVNNGGVAYYAVAVASSSADAGQLEYVENGGVVYLRYKTRWHAVWSADGAREIKIDSFTHGGRRAEEIYISPNAFAGNLNITSATIGSAVREIGASAFANSGISTLRLPASGLTKIGESAFNGCYSLKSVTIPNGITVIEKNAFASCGRLNEIKLPQTVRSIGVDAFTGCNSLVSISLPTSLTQIGGGAFSGCYSLKEINFPANLTYIGAAAFQSCAELKSVRLPDRLASINEFTFAYCTSLGDVVLPKNLVAIGSNAFLGCASLYQVHNLSGLNVRVGSDGYGKVAYYAYKVFDTANESLSFAEQDSCKFVLVDGVWYLHGCGESYYRTAKLPEGFTADGKTVSVYALKKGSLNNFSSVIVPVSVYKIEEGALGANAEIYYCGTQSQWRAIRPLSLANASVYFYTDKIDGRWQWTYGADGSVIAS